MKWVNSKRGLGAYWGFLIGVLLLLTLAQAQERLGSLEGFEAAKDIFDVPPPTNTATSDILKIEERTVYGITENLVYITLTDLGNKKNQYIVSSDFANDPLINSLTYKTAEVLDSYESPVYESQLVSIGKYKTAVTDSKNGTITYYNNKGEPMFCEEVLADKSCLQTKSVQTGTEKKYHYVPVQNLTTAKTILGQKASFKSEGRITVPKGGTIHLRYRVKHPLFYNFFVPAEINKYDIVACGKKLCTHGDCVNGCTVLDPTWWDTSYSYSRNILSINGTQPINGTSPHDLDGDGLREQCYAYNCSSTVLDFYYNSSTVIGGAIADDDTTECYWFCTSPYLAGSSANKGSDGLIMYLPFDNGFDQPHDYSGYDRNGTPYNTPTKSVTGQINDSWSFAQASSEYIAFDEAIVPNNLDFSIAIWQNVNTGIRNGRAYHLGSESSSNLISFINLDASVIARLRVGGTYNGVSDSSPTFDSWVHYTMTFNRANNTLMLYKNGEFVGADYSIGAIGAWDQNFYIGRQGASAQYYYDGELDDFRIYNKTLTAQNIKDIYNLGATLGAQEEAPPSRVPGPLGISWGAWTGYNTTTAANSTTVTWTTNATATECNLTVAGLGTYTNTTAGTSFSKNLTNLPDATYTMYVNCSNTTSNGNSTEATWTIDTTPPTITWNWTDINSTITVNTTTIRIDFNELANCTLYFNGTAYGNGTAALYNTWALELANGNYSTINATCKNAFGLSSESTNAYLVVAVSSGAITGIFIASLAGVLGTGSAVVYIWRRRRRR